MQTDSPTLSIIVPIYKTEKYLKRCMDSLLGQTLKELEIILVDDGSPDGCPALCDSYARLDPRVFVIHKQNEGLGLARNSGLNAAHGEYIAFVDSDDYVDLDMYNAMIDAAKKYDAALVMTGFCCVGGTMAAADDGHIEFKHCFDKLTIFENTVGINSLLLGISGALPSEHEDSRYGFSSVKNIYRRRDIERLGLRFMSERKVMSEDVFFLLDYISGIDRAVGLPGAYYFYCRNGDSLSKSYRADRIEKCSLLIDGINGRLAKRMKQEEFLLYTDRLMQAYARAASMQEIMFAKSNGITKKKLKRRLKKICENRHLSASLARYPISKLPPAQSAFAFAMKHRLVTLEILLVKLRVRSSNK